MADVQITEEPVKDTEKSVSAQPSPIPVSAEVKITHTETATTSSGTKTNTTDGQSVVTMKDTENLASVQTSPNPESSSEVKTTHDETATTSTGTKTNTTEGHSAVPIKDTEKLASVQISPNPESSSEVKITHDETATTSSGTKTNTTDGHSVVPIKDTEKLASVQTSSSPESSSEVKITHDETATTSSGTKTNTTDGHSVVPIKDTEKLASVQISPNPESSSEVKITHDETATTSSGTKTNTTDGHSVVPMKDTEKSVPGQSSPNLVSSEPASDPQVQKSSQASVDGTEPIGNPTTVTQMIKETTDQKCGTTAPSTSDHSQKSNTPEIIKSEDFTPSQSVQDPVSDQVMVKTIYATPTESTSTVVDPQSMKTIKLVCKVRLLKDKSLINPDNVISEYKPGSSETNPFQVKSIRTVSSSKSNSINSTTAGSESVVMASNTNLPSISANELLRRLPITNIINDALNQSTASMASPTAQSQPVITTPPLTILPTPPQPVQPTPPPTQPILGVSVTRSKTRSVVSTKRPSPWPIAITKSPGPSTRSQLKLSKKASLSDTSKETVTSPRRRKQMNRAVKRLHSPVKALDFEDEEAKRRKHITDPDWAPEISEKEVGESDRVQRRRSLRRKLRAKRKPDISIEEDSDVLLLEDHTKKSSDSSPDKRQDRWRQKSKIRSRIKRKLIIENPSKRVNRGRVCCVESCGASSLEFPDLTFISIPRQIDRFIEWATRLGRPDYIKQKKAGQVTFDRVCSLHFHDSALSASGVKIRRGALPTECLDVMMNVDGSDYSGSTLEDKQSERRKQPERQRKKKKEESLPDEAGIQPVFSKKLFDIKVKTKKELLLICKINMQSADIQWYHNGQKINTCEHYVTGYNKKKEDGKFVVSLKITKFNLHDVGIYTCHARNNKLQAATSCFLSLGGCDDIDAIGIEVKRCFKCDGKDPLLMKPKLTGMLAKQTVSIAADEKEKTKPITSTAAVVKDSSAAKIGKPGVDSREAEKLNQGTTGTDVGNTDANRAGRNVEIEGIDYKKVKRQKKIKPENLAFIEQISQTLANSGKGIALACRVNQSRVAMRWFHNGKKLIPCCHNEIILSLKEESLFAGLIVQPIGKGDDGIYTCVATDGKGDYTSTSSMIVIGGYGGTVITEEKQCMNGRCLNNEDQPHSPHVTRLYAKDMVKASKRAKDVKAKSMSKPSSLPFGTPPPPLQDYDDDDDAWDDDRDDADASMTQPTAPASTTQPAAPVPITQPAPPAAVPTHDNHIRPVFIKKLQDVAIRTLKSVRLACAVNVQSAGHDWYHNGRKIVSCQDYIISRSTDVKANDDRVIATLFIENVISEDTGVYTCVATNKTGSISTSAYVSIAGENEDHLIGMECQKCKTKERKLRKNKVIKKKAEFDVNVAPATTAEKQSGKSSTTSDKSTNSVPPNKAKQQSDTNKEYGQNTGSPVTGDKDKGGNTSLSKTVPNRTVINKQAQGDENKQEQPSTSTSVEGPPEPEKTVVHKISVAKNTEKNDDQKLNDFKTNNETKVSEEVDRPIVTKVLRVGAKLPSKSMELKCTFKFPADTSFKWLYLGNVIRNCEHYRMEGAVTGKEVTLSLILNPVVPVDMGVYTCLARGKFEVASTSCSITMKGASVQDYHKLCQKCISRASNKNMGIQVLTPVTPSAAVAAHVVPLGLPTAPLSLPTAPGVLPTAPGVLPTTPGYWVPVQSISPATAVTVKQETKLPEHSYNRTSSMKRISMGMTARRQDGKVYRSISCQTPQTQTRNIEKMLDKGDMYAQKARTLQRALARSRVTILKNKEQHEKTLKQKVTLALAMEAQKRAKEEASKPPVVQYNVEQPVVVKKMFVNKRSVYSQTVKKLDPTVTVVNLRKRHKELQKSLSAISGKFGAAKKEVARLETKMQLEERKHIVAISELQKKVAELEGKMERNQEQSAYHTLTKQLQQNRGRDPNAYAGFLQYMAEPAQEFIVQ